MRDESMDAVINNLGLAYEAMLALHGRADRSYAWAGPGCARLRDVAYHLGKLYPAHRDAIAAAVKMTPKVWSEV